MFTIIEAPIGSYLNGVIYALYHKDLPKFYIGSSINIKHRIYQHIDSVKNKCESKEIVKLENWQYLIIERYPCNNRQELCMREQYYIDLNINKVVNKRKAYSTAEELAQQNLDNSKAYYHKNKSTVIQKQVDRGMFYCECKLSVQMRVHTRHLRSLEHKDRMKIINGLNFDVPNKYNCICGLHIDCLDNSWKRNKHLTSPKHDSFMKLINSLK